MKRYDSYKDSGVEWIGEVPNHWNCARLKFYSEPLKSGGTPKSDNDKFYSEDGTPWVAISDMSSTNYILDTEKHLTQEGIDDKRLIVYPIGTILYSIYATLGKVSELGVPACINQAILAIVPKSNYNREYFKYCLQAQEQYVFSLSNGNTQNNLNAGKVANFMLTLPPLSEQQTIASYLDKRCEEIDKAIAKQQKRIELLQELRQNIITNAVTRGINPDAPLKDSGVEWIGKVPEHWEIKHLKYICKINGRVGYRGYTTNDLVQEGEGAYTIGGKHIASCKLDLSDADFISWEKYYESPEIMVRKGDIVIAQRGSLGKAALIEEEIGEATINPSLVLLNRILVNAKFLHYYLISNATLTNILLLNTATAVPMISQNQISNMKIPIPPLSEQQQIVNNIECKTVRLDKSVISAEHRIDLLQELKQSIITEVVTGKRKVC